jgi:hypothetical protein
MVHQILFAGGHVNSRRDQLIEAFQIAAKSYDRGLNLGDANVADRSAFQGVQQSLKARHFRANFSRNLVMLVFGRGSQDR